MCLDMANQTFQYSLISIEISTVKTSNLTYQSKIHFRIWSKSALTVFNKTQEYKSGAHEIQDKNSILCPFFQGSKSDSMNA